LNNRKAKNAVTIAASPEADMRQTVLLISILVLAGCTAVMVGNGGSSTSERSASVVASDATITSKITGKFAADDIVSVFEIGVRTYKGTVTLSGSVGSIAARNRAESIARDTKGVTAVNNQIVLEDRSR
jgi:osmotically-inducible protein OsmY